MSLEGRRIAVIEDDPIMGESLVQCLNIEGADVSLYTSGHEARSRLGKDDLDLIICDIRLPDTNGQHLFSEFGIRHQAPPFLFMTAYGEVDQAVNLMREGAADYLTKPFDMDVFLKRVEDSVRPSPARVETGDLGVSPPIRQVEALLRRVASIDSPILLTGETGSGKEVCARFLHKTSGDSGPFMAVNCAAIPADLLESELFGHEAGAFTGAGKRHLGYAERAGSGTLFLDEIGELALPLQSKLLRLIEDKHFYRLGGEAPVPFKARLVSATNADLGERIEEKRFRSDLYYRLNVVEVVIPPLRERTDDVPWLMRRFFELLRPHDGGGVRGISLTAEQAAIAYPWPGNVRELRNRMERAMALCLSGCITAQDLFPEAHSPLLIPDSGSRSLAEARNLAERQQIALVLGEHDGQIGKTAEALGVSRTTLWEKMKRYGLTGH